MSEQPAGQPSSFTAPGGGLEWLGEPGGQGVGLLKDELTSILDEEGHARRAWLSRVRYAGEERVRIALVIDGVAPADQMAAAIAPACMELVNLDLLFFDRMPARHVAHFESLPSFYQADAG